MWYFQSLFNDDRKFCILPGKEYIIGRKECDIIIENDQSVSRKHAYLKVAYKTGNADCSSPPIISITDISKFGTLVNNKIVKGEKLLQHGDEIKFGSPKSVHRVLYEPFVITMSCLDKNGKKEARNIVSQLGGVLSNDWRKDCIYLIMKNLTVTIKVVCALVSQKAIITVGYLSDLLKYLKGEIPTKPDPEKYLPTVTDNLIRPGVSFQPSAKRLNVFLGMTFYFLCHKQFQKMSLAVELGGAVPVLMDDPPATDLDAFLEAKTVVMNPAPGEVTDKSQKDWVDKVKTFLMKKGKYMVQDAEVGYAVLYCSTEDYCNPDKDISHLSFSLASQNLASQMAQDTQIPSLTTNEPAAAFPRPFQVGDGKTVWKHSQTVPGSNKTPADMKSNKDTITASESLPESERFFKNIKGRVGSSKSPSPDKDKELKVKEEPLTPDVESKSASFDSPMTRVRSQSTSNTNKKETSTILSIVDLALTHYKQTTVRCEEGGNVVNTSVSTSQALFDTELTTQSNMKKEMVEHLAGSQTFNLLDYDDEDAIILSKPQTPSQKHNRTTSHEDDPFDFAGKKHLKLNVIKDMEAENNNYNDEPFNSNTKKKTSKKTSGEASCSKSMLPVEEGSSLFTKEDQISRSKSPTCKHQTSESKRSRQMEMSSPDSEDPSSNPILSYNRCREYDQSVETAAKVFSVSGVHSVPSSSQSGLHSISTFSHVHLHGFLNTYQPIVDQVTAIGDFEPEDIKSPAVVVEYADLTVHAASRNRKRQKNGEDHSGVPEGHSDVPEGMMLWERRLVHNFKKFRKYKHPGAGRLPRIIGGSDLTEHCAESKKLDGWLKELQVAESQESQREKETDALFDWKPVKARGSTTNVSNNRGSTSNKRGR